MLWTAPRALTVACNTAARARKRVIATFVVALRACDVRNKLLEMRYCQIFDGNMRPHVRITLNLGGLLKKKTVVEL